MNYIKNILAIYDQADQSELAHGLNWYSDTHNDAFNYALDWMNENMMVNGS